MMQYDIGKMAIHFCPFGPLFFEVLDDMHSSFQWFAKFVLQQDATAAGNRESIITYHE